ncbi:MAG: BMP family ABC transporter substrate-binding protein, partial [Clostridia bacterium]|nr:BMP family ABC transporter substrate-binding protein [Clostridia bacterium]
CPDVLMKVSFTGWWYDEKEEKAAAESLIADGCDLISQHADSMGAPTACENAGIPNIAYNAPTVDTCPNTFIVSSRINWAPYFVYMINCVATGEAIATDWVGTIENGAVQLSEVNTQAAAAGTVEKLAEVCEGLVNGTVHPFDTATEGFITVGGEPMAATWQPGGPTDGDFVEGTPIVYDGYFHESEYRSAPYFDAWIDGIELLNTAFGS